MAINMHTAGKKSDWDQIAPSKWNFWQKTASSTRGLLTPANGVSTIGALLLVLGFLQFINGVTVPGLLLIALGRLADIFDGYIAHRTGTKSPLGEVIDTTIDKMTVLFGLLMALLFNLLPIIFILLITLQSLLNSTASLIARRRGLTVHPTQYGKLATFLAWFTMISYFLHTILSAHEKTISAAKIIAAISYIAFIFFVLLAVHSTTIYIKQLRGGKTRKTFTG